MGIIRSFFRFVQLHLLDSRISSPLGLPGKYLSSYISREIEIKQRVRSQLRFRPTFYRERLIHHRRLYCIIGKAILFFRSPPTFTDSLKQFNTLRIL